MLVLQFLALCALSQTFLDNGAFRFGNGTQDSINSDSGNFEQPFLWDETSSEYKKLTYSKYSMDSAVGKGGNNGSNYWNADNSQDIESASDQALDDSLFDSANNVGTLKYTFLFDELEFEHTYTLEDGNTFARITTKVTNKAATEATNVRYWVGTKDDWIIEEDEPTIARGNIDGAGFSSITNNSDVSNTVEISDGTDSVVMMSLDTRVRSVISDCCQFKNVRDQDPATSDMTYDMDGSYALFIRFDDLAPEASDEFTWYYCAGDLTECATQVYTAAEVSSSSSDWFWSLTRTEGWLLISSAIIVFLFFLMFAACAHTMCTRTSGELSNVVQPPSAPMEGIQLESHAPIDVQNEPNQLEGQLPSF